MDCPTVIVFTSPEAMVEFSGENKISALIKNPFNICKFIFVWKVNEKTFSPSPITNHAKTLCKEREIKSLTIQALGQLWITQSVMFAGNVYSPQVVARCCVMFLRVQKSKKSEVLSCFNFLLENILLRKTLQSSGKIWYIYENMVFLVMRNSTIRILFLSYDWPSSLNFIVNCIYNKILVCDWFSACLFVT